MYSNGYVAAGLGTLGTITAVSDWTVAGWCVIAVAASAAVGMAAKKLRSRRS